MSKMDAIKREIERKRKQLEDANLVGGNKKYFKRGELIAKHEEEYLKRHGLLQSSSAATSGSSNSKSSDNTDGNERTVYTVFIVPL